MGIAGDTLRVREADNTDRERWNAFFVSRTDLPPFALFEWKSVLERTYNLRCHWLLAENASGEICGVLPLYRGRSRARSELFGLRFGLIARDVETEVILLQAATDLAEREHDNAVTVCSGYHTLTDPPEGWRSDPRNTMIAHIGDGEDAAWMALRQNVRNNIRKGQKAGLTVEWGSEHLPNFHRVYADLMARKGLPGLSRNFFTNILDQLGEKAGFLAAMVNGRVVGGTLVLRSASLHHCTFQASDPYFSSAFAPTPAMEWEFIRSAIAAGATKADLGESTPESGTFRFKRRYGGKPTELHYYQYINSTRPKTSPNEVSQTMPPELSLRHRLYDAAPLWGKRWISQRRGTIGRVI